MKSGLLKFYIFISFILTMILGLLPLPEWAIWWRPAWEVLVLIFWTVYFPENISMVFVWLVGLLEDVLHFNPLGEHAMSLVIIYYLVRKMNYQLRTSPLWLQTFKVAILLLIYQLIIVSIQGVMGDLKYAKWFWVPIVSSVIVWPWLLLLMRDLSYAFSARGAKYN